MATSGTPNQSPFVFDGTVNDDKVRKLPAQDVEEDKCRDRQKLRIELAAVNQEIAFLEQQKASREQQNAKAED